MVKLRHSQHRRLAVLCFQRLRLFQETFLNKGKFISSHNLTC
ncbi:hypothetical protein HMPREF3212_04320 [Citrobacter freundii]|nr:hypothetical protein HMPREF3212_04320 [Citrobacter freundii]